MQVETNWVEMRGSVIIMLLWIALVLVLPIMTIGIIYSSKKVIKQGFKMELNLKKVFLAITFMQLLIYIYFCFNPLITYSNYIPKHVIDSNQKIVYEIKKQFRGPHSLVFPIPAIRIHILELTKKKAVAKIYFQLAGSMEIEQDDGVFNINRKLFGF